MKIAVAQVRPIVGHVECNVDRHLALTALALRHRAKLILFPELSLTGYEPSRALEFSRPSQDPCFVELQSTCNQNNVSIGVGVPVPTRDLPLISTLLFRPNDKPLLYAKMHLHPDEVPFFAPGSNSPVLIFTEPPVAMAICFELTVPRHARTAAEAGAKAYVASVAKTALGTMHAHRRLSEIAAEFSMPVFMANCLGVHDGACCAGGSAAWDKNGQLIAQLDDENEGVIVVDIESGEAMTSNLSPESP